MTMQTLYLSFMPTAGILQGVSGLLLVFDQGEVRKIVTACQGIIEYLQVSEVVQSMDEVLQFTKNLSGGTQMLRVGRNWSISGV